MALSSWRKLFSASLLAALCLAPLCATAGGIMVGGTRIIYPYGTKQTSVSIRNTSEHSSFLVQSWLENAQGNKSSDFIVTPPLYVSGPMNENTLRLMYVGKTLPVDRETLYYFNAKAIPSIDKKKLEGSNMLLLAAVTRIKLFVRPPALTPAVEKAPALLSFHRHGTQVEINNPTPYYMTLAKINIGGVKMDDIMVAPRSSVSKTLPANGGNTITFRTINDYGALTPEQSASMQ